MDFQPMPLLVYYLVFMIEITARLLPEIFLLIGKNMTPSNGNSGYMQGRL
ncbi:hypothetical protein ACEQPO_28590 [Bacillus sp. SL00103]